MPATRLVQWVPQIRVPRTPLNWSANPISVAIHNSQCRSKLWLSGCPSPAVGRFSTSTARFGNSKSRRTRGSANDNSSALDNSIFEQLFPSGQVHTTNTHTAANSPSQQPHAQASGAHSDVGGSARGEEGAPLEEDGAHGRKKGSRPVSNPVGGLPSEPAVLVVRNGSRSTLPSDFYRVAPRSAHLDGRAWSTMQAIQARDPDTQDPLDKYLLYFSSVAEAVAYKQELERLGALHATPEDKARVTLAPPDISTMTVELVRGAGAIQQIPGARHLNDILRHGLDTRNIVLIKLDGHQLTPRELKGLIRTDGERRNLPWKLTPSWGRSGIAVSIKGEIPRLRKPTVHELATDESPAESPDVVDPEATAPDAPSESWRDRPREQYFSRFFLSFHTVHDARRFVRFWHKRTLDVKDDGSRATVVNASLVW